MVLRIIDIETTGEDPAVDGIIEIASVDAVRHGKPTRPVQCLVNPGMAISPLASAVHHIVDADVRNALPIDKVISNFAGADVYVAHNRQFEQEFLSPHLGDVVWLCTYRCALRLWPNLPKHSLQALRYQLGYARPFDLTDAELAPHRALPDCYVTAAVLIALLNKAQEDGVDFKTLLSWSAEPPLMAVFSSGMHRGERFDAVDRSYLQWIIDKSNLDDGAKFSARYWLTPPAERLP